MTRALGAPTGPALSWRKAELNVYMNGTPHRFQKHSIQPYFSKKMSQVVTMSSSPLTHAFVYSQWSQWS